MKRSKAVHLVLLVSAAAGLQGCRGQGCVDEHGNRVNDSFCHGSSGFVGGHSYRTTTGYFGGGGSQSGTERGVFGGAGESAAHGGGGEGAGE